METNENERYAMSVFSRIISALSGESDRDCKIVEMAASVAQLSGGEVTFVSVVVPSLDPAHYALGAPMGGVLEAPPETEDELKGRMDARRTNIRETLAKAGATPSSYDLEVRHGRLDDELLRAADERRADLVVVGSHERSWIEGLFSSTTAQQVADFSKCPVLIVPEHEHA